MPTPEQQYLAFVSRYDQYLAAAIEQVSRLSTEDAFAWLAAAEQPEKWADNPEISKTIAAYAKIGFVEVIMRSRHGPKKTAGEEI